MIIGKEIIFHLTLFIMCRNSRPFDNNNNNNNTGVCSYTGLDIFRAIFRTLHLPGRNGISQYVSHQPAASKSYCRNLASSILFISL